MGDILQKRIVVSFTMRLNNDLIDNGNYSEDELLEEMTFLAEDHWDKKARGWTFPASRRIEKVEVVDVESKNQSTVVTAEVTITLTTNAGNEDKWFWNEEGIQDGLSDVPIKTTLVSVEDGDFGFESYGDMGKLAFKAADNAAKKIAKRANRRPLR